MEAEHAEYEAEGIRQKSKSTKDHGAWLSLLEAYESASLRFRGSGGRTSGELRTRFKQRKRSEALREWNAQCIVVSARYMPTRAESYRASADECQRLAKT